MGDSIPSIDVEEVSLAFGHPPDTRTVLDRVSFTVRPGECFGLVGASGSGKSSVLRCLAGLYEHWTGALRIEGKAQNKRLARRRGKALQMVFQDPYGSLHPRHMVDTILRDPLAMHRIAGADRRIEKVLAEVGLSESFRYRYPNELSGGQRQRVAIARALVLEPRILLLDEPTSALDVSVQAEILNLLSDIRRRDGLTCILVSHDLAVVAHMCERLAVMRRGRVVETMARSDLVEGRAQSAYAKFLVASSGPYTRALADRVEPD